MSVIQLNGVRRSRLGKGGARKARAAGQIPGVIYGHGKEPIALAVDNREFTNAMRTHEGGNPIVSLRLEGSDYTALVRDAQLDPLTRLVVHIDFQHISLTETVEVQVPLRAVGTPIGVKDGGGILEMIVRQLDVRCLPTAIPAAIDVDVNALNVGGSLHVRDIVVEGLTILNDPDATIITVVAPTVEEEVAAPVEGEAAAAPTEPEVVAAKGKKEEAPTAEKPEKPERPERPERAEREKK